MSTHRLFRVDWHGSCYVMAESVAAAGKLAESELLDLDAIGLEYSVDSRPVRLADVPLSWRAAYPFGKDPECERTVEQILKEKA